MAHQKLEIGMVGLGVMRRNLVLNIADHGYSISGYDKDLSKVQELQKALRASGQATQNDLIDIK